MKEPTPLFEKSMGRRPAGLAKFFSAGWVICKDILKLEPRSFVCSAPYIIVEVIKRIIACNLEGKIIDRTASAIFSLQGF